MVKKKGTKADSLMGDIAFAMTEYGPDFMHFLGKPLTGMGATINWVVEGYRRGGIKHLQRIGVDKGDIRYYKQAEKLQAKLGTIYETWSNSVLKVSGGKYPQLTNQIPRSQLLKVKKEIGRLTIECLRDMKPILQRMEAVSARIDSSHRMKRRKKSHTHNTLDYYSSMLSGIVSGFEKMQESFGKVQKHVDVNRVVKEVLEATAFFRQRKRSTDQKTIKIGVETRLRKSLPKTSIDPLTLMSALTNVFSNAQKAMGDSGRMTVETTRTKKNVFVRVRDTGPGIPRAKRKEIMEFGIGTHPGRFPEVKGWGTGLSLSSGLLEAQGGKLRILRTSTRGPNRGTTIQLRLPIKPVAKRRRRA